MFFAAISGNSSLVLESTVSLQEDDKEGILLSSDVAYALFGTTEVTGYKVTLDDQEYTIRGLLRDGVSTVVVPLDSQAELTVKALAADTDGMDKMEREAVIGRFTDQHGITANPVDYQIFKSLAVLLSGILPVIISFIICIAFITRAAVLKNKPFFRVLFWAGAVLSLVTAIFLSTKGPVTIPPSLIPSRWSDFESWKRVYEANLKEVTQVIYILKEKPEIQYLTPLLKVLGFSVSAGLLLWVSSIGMKIDSIRKCFGYVAISFILVYLVILTVDSQDLFLDNQRILWLQYPYFLLGKYLLELSNQYIGKVRNLDQS
ncbi:ABC transporter permease [Paenibacillus monticola]|uniref:Uncharacterized protein n=1 Tax=Paenibacillus monticola TaxID=2666075 RepID=A0A7X2H2Y1_9BACL|nr:ABC transporter permease [Paenibacillus monticola]MRN52587.1 hypothetical protein [Paenibacillus monticola]